MTMQSWVRVTHSGYILLVSQRKGGNYHIRADVVLKFETRRGVLLNNREANSVLITEQQFWGLFMTLTQKTPEDPYQTILLLVFRGPTGSSGIHFGPSPGRDRRSWSHRRQRLESLLTPPEVESHLETVVGFTTVNLVPQRIYFGAVSFQTGRKINIETPKVAQSVPPIRL